MHCSFPSVVQEDVAALKFIVVLWEEHKEEAAGAALGAAIPSCPVKSFSEVVGAGAAAKAAVGFKPYVAGPQDLATLVYTSGTTGERGRGNKEQTWFIVGV